MAASAKDIARELGLSPAAVSLEEYQERLHNS